MKLVFQAAFWSFAVLLFLAVLFGAIFGIAGYVMMNFGPKAFAGLLIFVIWAVIGSGMWYEMWQDKKRVKQPRRFLVVWNWAADPRDYPTTYVTLVDSETAELDTMGWIKKAAEAENIKATYSLKSAAIDSVAEVKDAEFLV